MNYVQRFLAEVGKEYELPYPDIFEEAFYILAERLSKEDFAELTKQITGMLEE